MKRRSNKWPWAIRLVSLLFLWLMSVTNAETLPVDVAVANPFAGRDDLVAAGKTLFNVHCSHCHGPNAVQGERPRDLRRLSQRYGDEMPAVFYKTATGGRADKGMPPWQGVLEDAELWKIFMFLETVQKK